MKLFYWFVLNLNISYKASPFDGSSNVILTTNTNGSLDMISKGDFTLETNAVTFQNESLSIK